MSEKTTPRPWTCCADDYKALIEAGVYGADGIRIATMVAPLRSIDKAANARFIVRCVNSHQALVDALKGTLEILTGRVLGHAWGNCDKVLKAKAALKLSEGGPDAR